jgi:hypothetical protein
MNRRHTIKTLMMASAGMVALPSWAREWSQAKIRIADIASFLSPGESDVLASVTDTIIPAGDAIGALDVGVDVFLTRLFSECYEPQVQDTIKLQLNGLDAAASETFEKGFEQCSQAEREGLFLSLAASGDPAQTDFFELVKGETIRGFLTSRQVLRDYYDYVAAPGHYFGCVNIDET